MRHAGSCRTSSPTTRWSLKSSADLGADVTYEPWDTEIEWAGFDAVAVRSPWDYSYRRDEFVAWAEAAGPNLHNSADLLRWNSDKSYVGDMAAAGLPVVETAFLEPGEEWAGDEREVIVKPSVSAGARDTGRFGPSLQDEARALIATIHESGRTAMVQPFLASVDSMARRRSSSSTASSATRFERARCSGPTRSRPCGRPT